MPNNNYTVQLVDNKYGRIVLDPVSASSASAAGTAAVAAPGVSGDNSGAGAYAAGQTVKQSVHLSVTGTLADGTTPFPGPTALPVIPEVTASPSF